MGTNSAIPYAFSYLSGFTYPAIAENGSDEYLGIDRANYVGFLFCVGSLVMANLLIVLDNRMNHHDEQLVNYANYELERQETRGDEAAQSPRSRQDRVSNTQLSFVQEQPVLLPLHSPRSSNLVIQLPVDEEERKEETCIDCSQLADFEMGFWLIALDCCLTYSIQFTITTLGQEMCVKHFKFDEKTADSILMLPNLIVMVLLPIVGFVADKIGKR